MRRCCVSFVRDCMQQQAGMRHNLEVKASKRKRRLNADQVLSAGDVKQAKKLLVR